MSWPTARALLLALPILVSASDAAAQTLASPLRMMLAIRARGAARERHDRLLPSIARDRVALSLRLREPPDGEALGRLAALGVTLPKGIDGTPAHVGPIYAASAPWSALEAIAQVPSVVSVDLARPPGLASHLDVSTREIGAAAAWSLTDGSQRRLDGTGVVVADFDSGIDVFHPMLFMADGGEYRWIDLNENGRLDPGIDAVDLDGNEIASPDEVLGLIEGVLVQGGLGWQDGVYTPDVDWLFNDSDADGVRDYGPEAGYTDRDPSFGELLLVSIDLDGDLELDVDEPLVALGTSKVIATLVWPDLIRYRGVDLIETPVVDPYWERTRGWDDRADHGTGVSSVMVGGWAGMGRRLTGVAPGAELILVDFNNELGLAATLPWAVALGARVATHPYGHKAFDFLDGSSNDELAIDHAVLELGAPQVVSVGNEAGSRADASATVPGSGSVTVPFQVVNYEWSRVVITMVVLTVRWRRPEVDLSFRIVDPEGSSADLDVTGGFERVGDAIADHERQDSSRGTARFDLIVSSDEGLLEGTWSLEATSPDDQPTRIVANILNEVYSSGMGTSFTDEGQIDPMATVNAVATADMALGACSYGTRQSYAGEVVGSLSTFSSRGPRIDGLRVVDICAPGDNDIFWAQASGHGTPFGAYSLGGGTSASAPHVGGAIALLRQAAPSADPVEIEAALLGGALADELVGPVPSDLWGYGKLRVVEALDLLLSPGPTPPPPSPDLAPWEDDVPTQADPLDGDAPSPPFHGIEGGGCHCAAASPGRIRRDPSIRNLILCL